MAQVMLCPCITRKYQHLPLKLCSASWAWAHTPTSSTEEEADMHLETVTEIAAVITPFKDLFNATHADVDVIGHISVFVSTWIMYHVLL